MGNAYLDKQKALVQEYVRASERITRQMMVDSLVLVLNDEFGFGYDRAKRTLDALEVTYSTYHDALTGGPEADYVQEKLDLALRRIVGDKGEFFPFEERYPDIKKITYARRRQKK